MSKELPSYENDAIVLNDYFTSLIEDCGRKFAGNFRETTQWNWLIRE